jgi:membrane protease YdiL (CAAX protease family)
MMGLLTLVLILPFCLLIVAANLGLHYRLAELLSYAGLIVLNLITLAGGLLLLLAGLLLGLSQEPLPPEAKMLNMSAFGVGLLLTGLVAWVPLLPPVRRAIARVLPIDPSSIVHATALVFLVVVVGSSLAELASLDLNLAVQVPGALPPLSYWDIILSELAYLVLAVLGVGFLVRRNLRATLERLGIGGLSWRQWLVTLGVIVLVFIADALLTTVVTRLFPGSEGPSGGIVKQLFGNLMNPLGAVVVGLSAGICEEALFRGAMQPRFGLLLTALTFAVVHVQYGLTWPTVEVFLLGLVLGYLRRRLNTTSCIAVHAGFNFLGLILAPLTP